MQVRVEREEHYRWVVRSAEEAVRMEAEEQAGQHD